MAVKIVPKDEMVNAIGTKYEPSDWIEVTQERINTFADCTEDHQFIHIDPEAAAKTPFGGTIAHGFLTLSLMSKMVEGNGVIPENTVMPITLRASAPAPLATSNGKTPRIKENAVIRMGRKRSRAASVAASIAFIPCLSNAVTSYVQYWISCE